VIDLRPGAGALAVVLTLMVTGCQNETAPQDETRQESAKAEPEADDPAVQIRRVLDADTVLSKRYLREQRSFDYRVWLENQRTYAAEMGAIRLEGTPRDFADAFRSHQAAWAAFTGYLAGLTEDEIVAIRARDRAGEPLANAIMQRSKELHGEIATTWGEVEMVAGTFGVGKGPSLRAPPTPVGSTHKLIRLQEER